MGVECCLYDSQSTTLREGEREREFEFKLELRKLENFILQGERDWETVSERVKWGGGGGERETDRH